MCVGILKGINQLSTPLNVIVTLTQQCWLMLHKHCIFENFVMLSGQVYLVYELYLLFVTKT